ncbi:MAG TPA: NfeD family protein [Aggregatilineaceae bacterium]|nr:NfeD family protein [Aggregatilineaceae bacterium]
MIPLTAGIVQDIFDGSILNMLYAAALFIGLVYSIFLLFFQGIEDALGNLDLDFSLDHDIDNASDVTGISLLAIASFISAFGAFGLIAVTLFDAGSAASLISALLGGLGMGLVAQLSWVYLLSPTVSSEVRQAKLVGTVAEIITPIPMNGLGQIAFIAEGSRITYSARSSEHDQSISRGTPVRIERIVGGVAYVSAIA